MLVEKNGVFFDINKDLADVYFRNGFKEVKAEEPKAAEPKAKAEPKRGRPKKK